MSRFKIGFVSVLAIVSVVALIPASAMAASHATVTIGQVGALNLDGKGNLSSFTVNTPPIPTGKVVTVSVNKNTKMIPMSGTAQTNPFVASDYVWASGGVGKHQFASTVKYDTAPFAVAYAKRTFNGTFLSSSAAVPPNVYGTLVIKNKAGKALTFNTSTATKYRLNGKKVSIAPTFKFGQRITVYGQEYTDGSWLAQRVDAFKK